MVWPAVIAAGVTLASSVISGKESTDDRRRAEAEAQAQRDQNELGMFASSPREETLPFLDQNLQNVNALFGERDEYFGESGTTSGLEAAINKGLYGEQVGRDAIDQFSTDARNAEATGRFNVNPNDVASGAESLLNSSLIDSQVDAYGRDIGRTLGENTITGIRSADIATGNLGSSRGGVQEAIARRSAEDRIADFRGNLTGQALQQAQQLAQSNANTNLGLFQNQFNVAQTQEASDRARTEELANVGSLQRDLEQARLNNLTGSRDFDLQNQLEYSDYLTGQSKIGNFIPNPNK